MQWINEPVRTITVTHNNNNNRLTALCPRLPGWTGTKRNAHSLIAILIMGVSGWMFLQVPAHRYWHHDCKYEKKHLQNHKQQTTKQKGSFQHNCELCLMGPSDKFWHWKLTNLCTKMDTNNLTMSSEFLTGASPLPQIPLSMFYNQYTQ